MSKFYNIINGDKPVLVDFYADWCGPCKMMAPILKELSPQVKGMARVIKVDVDKNQPIAAKYGIRSIPTTIIFKNGVEKWRHSGVLQASVLKQELEKYK